jgi:hypothetical protein
LTSAWPPQTHAVSGGQLRPFSQSQQPAGQGECEESCQWRERRWYFRSATCVRPNPLPRPFTTTHAQPRMPSCALLASRSRWWRRTLADSLGRFTALFASCRLRTPGDTRTAHLPVLPTAIQLLQPCKTALKRRGRITPPALREGHVGAENHRSYPWRSGRWGSSCHHRASCLRSWMECEPGRP